MKKILVVFALAAFVFASCNMKSDSQTEETTEATAVEVKAETEKKECCDKEKEACCEKDSTKACCDKDSTAIASEVVAEVKEVVSEVTE